VDDDNIVCENSSVIIKTSKAILDSAYRCMCAHVEVSMVLHIRIMCSVKVMRFLIFLFWKKCFDSQACVRPTGQVAGLCVVKTDTDLAFQMVTLAVCMSVMVLHLKFRTVPYP